MSEQAVGGTARGNETRRFSGVRPILHLAFATDDSILHTEVAALARSMLDAGMAGLVVLGLSAEPWTLTDAERDAVLRTAAEAVAGRAPIVAGIDGTTALAVARGRAAAAAGASGLMVLPPPSAGSTEQLRAHYSTLADATGLPILVQDAPQSSGVTMAVETIVALARHPLVRSVKVEAQGAGSKVTAIVEAGIEVIAGWGGMQYPELLMRGASGCMPGCDLGPALLEIDRLAREGDGDAAFGAYLRMLPLLSWEAQSLDLLLLGAKRVLCRRGIFSSDRLRSPGRGLDRVEARTLDRIVDRLAADGVPGFEERCTNTKPPEAVA